MKKQINQIVVDKIRFNQVFYNLLSNAAKYTPEGGKVEFYSEKIEDRNEKSGMRFHVKDNGIGMSQGYQKVLFDPFTQEYSKVHKEQKGTGLGLAIVKQIVDLVDGTITVQSELGKGTEFIVDLFACHVTDAEEISTKVQYDIGKMRGLHVLLVDDTEINTSIVKKMLEYRGCIVDVALNGQAGVEMFSNSKSGYYDIILTDVRMPVMDGFEEARCIRSMDRPDAQKIPIVAATADAYDDILQKIKDAGMNERLIKPIESEQLCQTIVRLIEISD